MTGRKPGGKRPGTILAGAGRPPKHAGGAVNVPVYRVSTVLFPTLADLEAAEEKPYDTLYYGRLGTPTSWAFEEAAAEIEGGYRSVALSSGMGAIATALMAFLKAGDHLLMVDSVYGPTRRFCDTVLRNGGVETTYYDPMIGRSIAGLIKPNTRVVFVEAPGSLTFEIQDIPAIAETAHKQGARVLMDNTWATPLFFDAIGHGVDVSIHAATKYMVGHADAMLGVVTAADKETWFNVKATASVIGNNPGSEELYLGLRGLRTLQVRLRQHQESALAIATFLAGRPEVKRVLHPAFESCPGHETWKRDFTGASGLFSVVLDELFDHAAVARMLDGLEHFGMGFSWGGFESLAILAHPDRLRTAVPWSSSGPVIRFHAGLDDPDDLIADLDAGLRRLA